MNINFTLINSPDCSACFFSWYRLWCRSVVISVRPGRPCIQSV